MAFYSLQHGQVLQTVIEGVTVTVTVQVLNSTTKLITCTGKNGVDLQLRLQKEPQGLVSVLVECNFTYMSRVVFVELSRLFQVQSCVAKENWRSIVNRYFKQEPNTVLFTDLPFGFFVSHHPLKPLLKSLQLLKKEKIPMLESCDFIIQAPHPAACPAANVLCSVNHPRVQKALETVASYFQHLVFEF